MTITSLFYRFLKERNIYAEIRKLLTDNFYKLDNLDGFLSDKTLDIVQLLQNVEMMSFNHTSIVSAWNYFLQENKHMIDVKPRESNLTIATELLLEFMELYHIKKEIIMVLSLEHNIKKITHNVIDEHLIKNGTLIKDFFISTKTFALWADYDYLLRYKENINEEWSGVNLLWREFIENKNIKNMII